MATKLFLLATVEEYCREAVDQTLALTNARFRSLAVSTTAGSSATSASRATTTGPTNGLEPQVSGENICWYTPPLGAAVTISGSITWNIWAAESSASANVAINGRIEKVDGATGAVTVIDTTVRTTEVALTTRAVNNFAKVPAAGIACAKGDRLRIRVFGDDAGTMATAFTFTVGYGGPTAAADGDTFVTLTENLTFVAEPAGTQVFPTDTASTVATASNDKEAWTSRGGGVATAITTSAIGFSPIQVTDAAGGTVVDWFTRPLTALTLAGAVRVNVRDQTSLTLAHVGIQVEIASVAADGTGATVFGKASYFTDVATTEAARSFLVAGPDLAVSAGQCLRLRLSLVAAEGASGTGMAARTITLFYAGAAGATGDTFLTFTQTLTELIVPPGPHVSPYPQILAH